MKHQLIMENWRKFLVESADEVNDPNPFDIKFKFQLIGESQSLESTDADPESLSIADLEKIPAEKMSKTYINLAQKELTPDRYPRIREKNQRYKELQKGKRAAGKEIADLEVEVSEESGMGAFLRGTMNFLKKLVGAEIEVSPEDELASAQQEVEEIQEDLYGLIMEYYTPLEREIFRAITLFTGDVNGWHIIQGRESYDAAAEGGKPLVFAANHLFDRFTPSQETFDKARVILQKLTTADVALRGQAVPLYRGAKSSVSSKRYDGLETLRVGKVLELGLSSFSKNYSTAIGFSAYDDLPTDDPEAFCSIDGQRWGVIYMFEVKKGVDVSHMSQHDYETEVLSSGKFQITDIGYDPNVSYKRLSPTIRYPITDTMVMGFQNWDQLLQSMKKNQDNIMSHSEDGYGPACFTRIIIKAEQI